MGLKTNELHDFIMLLKASIEKEGSPTAKEPFFEGFDYEKG